MCFKLHTRKLSKLTFLVKPEGYAEQKYQSYFYSQHIKKYHLRFRNHECYTTSYHLFCPCGFSRRLQILSGKSKGESCITECTVIVNYGLTSNYQQLWIYFLDYRKILRALRILLASDSVYFLPQLRVNSIGLFIGTICIFPPFHLYR